MSWLEKSNLISYSFLKFNLDRFKEGLTMEPGFTWDTETICKVSVPESIA